MRTLPLADCIRSTPAGTLMALTRELSHRARRSLGRQQGAGRTTPDQADHEVVPAWTHAVRAISASRSASTQH